MTKAALCLTFFWTSHLTREIKENNWGSINSVLAEGARKGVMWKKRVDRVRQISAGKAFCKGRPFTQIWSIQTSRKGMKTGGKNLRSFPALGSSGSQGGLLESWLGRCRWATMVWLGQVIKEVRKHRQIREFGDSWPQIGPAQERDTKPHRKVGYRKGTDGSPRPESSWCSNG